MTFYCNLFHKKRCQLETKRFVNTKKDDLAFQVPLAKRQKPFTRRTFACPRRKAIHSNREKYERKIKGPDPIQAYPNKGSILTVKRSILPHEKYRGVELKLKEKVFKILTLWPILSTDDCFESIDTQNVLKAALTFSFSFQEVFAASSLRSNRCAEN